MAQRFPQDFIDEILSRLDIVEVVSKRIELKKKGHEYHALCPFHSEKTPSFTVSPTKRFYYCFGCGASGNALHFMMQFDHIDFRAAIIQSAHNLGLKCPEDDQDDELYQLNRSAKRLMQHIQSYYSTQLKQSKKALLYLHQRGLDHATIERYGLGLSPKHQPQLNELLNIPSHQMKTLLHTGMMYTDEHGRYHSRFRGRIIFPIRNIAGETIAFGGRRAHDGPGPKYLNSPETALFKKSSELYGLYEIKQLRVTPPALVVVEGYMDVISLAQHGFNHAVATLGTAINMQHILNLSRHTSHVIFCFDGDEAGQRAAWRAMTQSLPVLKDHLDMSFIFLPKNEDPDSFIRTHGLGAFLKAIESATTSTDFFFEHIQSKYPQQTLSGRAAAAQDALEWVQKIPNSIFRHMMEREIQSHFKLTEDELKSKTSTESPIEPSALNTNVQIQDHVTQILSMLLQDPSIHKHLFISPLLKEHPGNKIKWLFKLYETIQEHPNLSTAALLQRWESHHAYSWLVQLASSKHLTPRSGFLTDCQHRLETLKDQLIQKKIDAILEQSKSRTLSTEEKQALSALIKIKAK
ncbi:MAG: DNA primase [Legionellales bacterium]|nr:DNA primase [Legionellales bacterium]